MNIELSILWIIGVMLLTVRLGIVFYSTPIYSFAPIPGQVKLLFVVALSALMMFVNTTALSSIEISMNGLLESILLEMLIGLLLAFSIQVVFAAFQWGGRVMDMQIGFSVANLIDPTTRTQIPMMGTLLSSTALLVFYALDGHHMLMRGLAYSVEMVPPGGHFEFKNPTMIVLQFGMIFTSGLSAVAPVVFALTMIDMVIAVAARTMPQMNVFFVGLPIKIFVGLMVFSITVRYMLPFMQKMFETMFRNWNTILSG